MPANPPPYDETERLRALRLSGLLRSSTDPRLDAIVQYAAEAFTCPIAAISLLDQTTQYFKVSLGLGVPQTPREVAFCSYAILGSQPMVVLDAAKDPRFMDNALVLGEPGVRFYAGAPVFGPGGLPMGALCVIDIAPRPEVRDELLHLLQGMAGDVTAIFAQTRNHGTIV